jgi:ligand-binding SRPBCC domain-containing protein
VPEFQASVTLPQAVTSVFDFVRRPRNLVKLLAGSTEDFEYRVPEILQDGSALEFCLKRFGMRIDVVLEVVEVIDQQRIFLKQRKGPFHRWFHEYVFVTTPEQSTHLTERVFFEPPSGFLGMFITSAGILEQLQKRIPSGHHQLKEQVSKLPS